MTDQQKRASDPARHVWVAASAGSGKTKVLTDRVLRLLLAGTLPHRILCLTYTNAAAAEMRARLQKTLTAWAVLPEEEVRTQLEALSGEVPDKKLLNRARRLFARLLDTPEGVRIQTVHAFCQSLLKRFPLEAGIAPQMELLTERTQKTLLKEARHRLLTQSDQSEEVRDAIRIIARHASADTLESLLDGLIGRRRQFEGRKGQSLSDSVSAAIEQWLGISGMADETSLAAAYLAPSPAERNELKALHSACAQGKTKGAGATAERLAEWLATPAPDFAQSERFARHWLTTEGEPKQLSSIFGKDVADAFPAAPDVLAALQSKALAFMEALTALRALRRTRALLTLLDGLLGIYAKLKRQRAMLDYDDLILATLRLLHEPGMSQWVLFKLDGGLDHVLVDEAQDTSREQWEIVQLLTQEFFSGASANPRPRSLFVVGDEKQSIYRFQGAQPEIFDRMRAHFQESSRRAEAEFERVRLVRSFRSAPAVLAAVDAVFARDVAKAGLDVSESIIRHEANRHDAPGIVELWPLTMAPEGASDEEEESAALPAGFDAAGQWRLKPPKPRAEKLHANLLAHAIAHWLKSRRILAGKGRPVKPGDIMVLVRKRGPFVDALVRQLKSLNVPVAGADRLELNAQLAVKDILAVLDVCLLPQDDLTLAAALRSPIFNLSESGLFALAHGRGETSLFARLQQAAQDISHPYHADALRIHAELAGWMNMVDYQPPYLLLSDILHRHGGMIRLQKRLGPQIIDPVEELLRQALEYGMEECASLQGFLAWMRAGKTEIKRDMEHGQDEVRILTVHGSKGLQAPIVILADTLNMQGQAESLLWHEPEGGMPLPLWPGPTKFSKQLKHAKEAEKIAEQRERNRQLYVAMTRAEDELYITGWKPHQKRDDSWYDLVRDGLQAMPEGRLQQYAFTASFPRMPGTLLAQLAAEENQPPMLWRLADADPGVAMEPEKMAAPSVPSPLPAWVHRAPPGEPVPPRPLTPSQLDSPVPVSVPNGLQAEAMRRGQLVHGLLQWLPETPPETRATRGGDWLRLTAMDMEESARATLLAQVLGILAEPAFAAVFAPGSLAEVPISGMVMDASGNPRIINAQVDRLLIASDRVFVADYKTTQNPPTSLERVPVAYLRQMAAYRDLLRRIYPSRSIECGLVFTQGPSLMVLPDILLDRVI